MIKLGLSITDDLPASTLEDEEMPGLEGEGDADGDMEKVD